MYDTKKIFLGPLTTIEQVYMDKNEQVNELCKQIDDHVYASKIGLEIQEELSKIESDYATKLDDVRICKGKLL